MTLMKYKIFQKVAECESFTKASLELNMTQSAVSHAIGSLEKNMGFSLFIRVKNKIELTNEGRRILNQVNLLLASEHKLLNEINKINNVDVGLIRIGSFSSASNRFVPPIIRAFLLEYPNTKIEIREGSYKEIRLWLETGEIDVAFTVENYVTEKNYSVAFYKDEILAVLPSKFATKYNEYFDIKDFENLPFILPDSMCDKFVEDMFKEHDVTPNIIYKIRLNSTVFSMLEEDLGVSFAAKSNLFKLNYDFISLPFKNRIYRQIYLVSNKVEVISPIIKKFFDIAQNIRLID